MKSINEVSGGNTFASVFDAFVNHKPIRNTNWAKGVYVKLKPSNSAVVMYYVDDINDIRSHNDTMDYLSVRSLVEPNWITVNEEEIND